MLLSLLKERLESRKRSKNASETKVKVNAEGHASVVVWVSSVKRTKERKGPVPTDRPSDISSSSS